MCIVCTNITHTHTICTSMILIDNVNLLNYDVVTTDKYELRKLYTIYSRYVKILKNILFDSHLMIRHDPDVCTAWPLGVYRSSRQLNGLPISIIVFYIRYINVDQRCKREQIVYRSH